MSITTGKILVIGPAWVGDMVLAQSLFKTLKINNPHCHIDVAAPAWTLPLLTRMPEVSAGIALPFQHRELALMARIKLGKSLKNKGYTQAIILTNSFKSALIPFAAGIKQRTSYLGEMRYGLINDIRPLNKIQLKKTVERFVNLGLKIGQVLPTPIPQPKLIPNQDEAYKTLKKLSHVSPSDKILGLCPGAEYGTAKRWPSEYYAEVANTALKQGWQVWLFGSSKDIPVTTAINQLTRGECLDLGGKTNLIEAVDLMSLCNTIVSNDSGLMHIAAALDKKLIAIFGSSTPDHTPPMHPTAVIKYLALDCSPCFKRECPLQHLNCLRQLTPGNIINDIRLINQ